MKTKNNMKIKWFVIAVLLFSTIASIYAKDTPPKPNTLVNDYAGILDPASKSALESKLVAYFDSTSTQIAVVIEPSLDGEDIFEYSLRIAESWGIGSKDKDNGILLYVSVEDRKLFIHTGRGVQDYLTDNLSKRIIENIIKPAFRQGDYYGGVDRATDAMIQLGAGRFSNDLESSKDGGGSGLLIVIIVFVGMILLFSFLSRMGGDDGPGGGYHRGGHYDYDSRRRGGGWVIFPGSGGGWGGGGSSDGGGFGGFGGGGFDGGGAGGDW